MTGPVTLDELFEECIRRGLRPGLHYLGPDHGWWWATVHADWAGPPYETAKRPATALDRALTAYAGKLLRERPKHQGLLRPQDKPLPTRRMGRPLVPVVRGQLLSLRQQGYTWPEVAEKLGISRSTAMRIYRYGGRRSI